MTFRTDTQTTAIATTGAGNGNTEVIEVSAPETAARTVVAVDDSWLIQDTAGDDADGALHVAPDTIIAALFSNVHAWCNMFARNVAVLLCFALRLRNVLLAFAALAFHGGG